MAVCSFAHCEAALSLQAAYSDYQIGAFENFHQPVEDTLVILRPGPKVVFQYELRFVNRLKSQLLISHLFLSIKQMPSREKEETRNQAAFRKYPHFFKLSDQFLFQSEKPSAHAFGVKRKSDFGSPGPAPAHQRAAGGVLARRPEILFARHTLPPATGEELRPLSGLTRPPITAPRRRRSPRMAAMRRAAVELAVEGRLRPAALAQHLADRNATGGSQGPGGKTTP
jgi:hypothetical protein